MDYTKELQTSVECVQVFLVLVFSSTDLFVTRIKCVGKQSEDQSQRQHKNARKINNKQTNKQTKEKI
jgi:hypothetical protein